MKQKGAMITCLGGYFNSLHFKGIVIGADSISNSRWRCIFSLVLSYCPACYVVSVLGGVVGSQVLPVRAGVGTCCAPINSCDSIDIAEPLALRQVL